MMLKRIPLPTPRQALKYSAVLCLAASVAWVWLFFSDVQRFPIETVKITGHFQHISREDVEKRIAPHTNTSFYRFSVNQIKDELLALPWVERVVVTRVWPSTIDVKLTEHKAIATWNRMGLIDTRGQLFLPSKESFPVGLPHLMGPAGQQKRVLDQYGKFEQRLKPLGLNIAQIEWDSRGAWTLVLNKDVKIIIGREKVDAKLERFVQVYPKIRASRSGDPAQVDLRYNNGLSVKWRT